MWFLKKRPLLRPIIRTFALLGAAFLGGAAVEMVRAPHLASGAPEEESPFFLTRQVGRALAQIEREYVDPVSRQKLLDGSIRGMVGNLDPHSSYMNAEEFRSFQGDTAGRFGGIGVEVDIRGEAITILSTIEGSPADRAGLRSGDRIVGVDSEGLGERGLDKLLRKLRGPSGSKVRLMIRREGVKEPFPVDLVREEIRVAPVLGKSLENQVAYIRIKQFSSDTHGTFLRELGKLRQKGPVRRVILDLRSNPGGLVDEAVAIADEFLNDGSIFSMRARGKLLEEARATSGGALVTEPVVVLVDEWSASAAELLAGALQDHKRARVVGMITFGKGSVQTVYDLPGGGGLKLTTARYYTPLGHAIQADGVHPDLAVSRRAIPDSDMTRERDLEGHLEAETTKTNRPPIVAIDGGSMALDPIRNVPIDPRKGQDEILRLGYEEVLRLSPGSSH